MDRVADILASRIRSGLYKAGDLLPTERVLAADLGVHRRSVRMAVECLADRGLLTHHPNCRPVIAGAHMPATHRTSVLADATRGAIRSGDHTPIPRISASNLIALIMWHGGGPLEHAGTAQQRIFWGMNQVLMKLGYHAVFLDLGDKIGSDEENAAREERHLRYVLERGFGGVLFYPYAYRHNAALVREVNRTVPIVPIDRAIAGVVTDFVGCRNRDASYELTNQLIGLGHRRIAHVTRVEPIQPVQDRLQGYLDAMRGAYAEGITEMVINLPPYKDDRYWTLVDAVFGLPKEQRPTAAVCLNDCTAEGLAKRLAHLGLSIPNDVAITGFDNLIPALENGAGLTTAAQPYEEIDATAIHVLMRRTKDPLLAPITMELPARLIIRESSEV